MDVGSVPFGESSAPEGSQVPILDGIMHCLQILGLRYTIYYSSFYLLHSVVLPFLGAVRSYHIPVL